MIQQPSQQRLLHGQDIRRVALVHPMPDELLQGRFSPVTFKFIVPSIRAAIVGFGLEGVGGSEWARCGREGVCVRRRRRTPRRLREKKESSSSSESIGEITQFESACFHLEHVQNMLGTLE